MNYVETNEGIKLDVQSAGVEMNEYLQRKIKNMIKKLKKVLPEINWVDVYLKNTDESVRPRRVVVRFGIPGPDIIASDTGHRWKILLKNVEKKLVRQLEKRKTLLNKQTGK